MAEKRVLFPKIEPYNSGMLRVSDLHTLYYEEVGNPQGIPVIFLHGGPGVGAQAIFRRFFDPQRFRVINFSQRGAGKSTPSGELRENDTWNLVGDIEQIRHSLGIERWFVFGGSWGSTLALTYAQTHPDRVRGLVLRGIYLGTQTEYNWMYTEGASHIFPEYWQRFIEFIPPAERVDLPAAYYRRLTSTQADVQLSAANHWYDWEDSIIRLLPRETTRMTDEDLLSFARIECHFIVNKLFFSEDDYLINNIQKIRHIPSWIAQGRYDICCPMSTALRLSQQMPNAYLDIVPDAGHAIAEPGLVDSLIRGMESLADRY